MLEKKIPAEEEPLRNMLEKTKMLDFIVLRPITQTN